MEQGIRRIGKPNLTLGDISRKQEEKLSESLINVKSLLGNIKTQSKQKEDDYNS